MDNTEPTTPAFSQHTPKKVYQRKSFIIIVFLLLILGLYLFFNISTQQQKDKQTTVTPTSTSTSEIIQETTAFPTPSTDRVAGQLIVQFKQGISQEMINQTLQKYNAHVLYTISGINATLIEIPVGQEEAIMKQLSQEPIVSYAEPDYIGAIQLTANDTLIKNQYALNNTGASVSNKQCTANADVNAFEAWDVTQGAGVKVGIIDTGIDTRHPELASKIVATKSFANTDIQDRAGHGTHVAGIIAAKGNNGSGVSGICPECTLVIAKGLNDNQQADYAQLSAAMTWTADQGPKIISMSVAGKNPSQTLQNAVNYIANKGIVLVGAVGNEGRAIKLYPAGYPSVVSVASTDCNDRKSSFSNYGSWISITAPGTDIMSTLPSGRFGYMSGTSMATPVVSGVAALIASTQHGTSATAIKQRLFSTAKKIAGTGQYWQNGRVDAQAAVGSPATQQPTTPASQPTTAPTSGDTNPQPSSISTPTTFITPTLYCLGSCPSTAPDMPTDPNTLIPPIDPSLGGNPGGGDILSILMQFVNFVLGMLGIGAPSLPISPSIPAIPGLDPNSPGGIPGISGIPDISGIPAP